MLNLFVVALFEAVKESFSKRGFAGCNKRFASILSFEVWPVVLPVEQRNMSWNSRIAGKYYRFRPAKNNFHVIEIEKKAFPKVIPPTLLIYTKSPESLIANYASAASDNLLVPVQGSSLYIGGCDAGLASQCNRINSDIKLSGISVNGGRLPSLFFLIFE